MNPNRFFMPGMGIRPIFNMSPNLGINSMMGTNAFVSRSGIFSRIANGIKSFNWSGLLNGANRTLNVVNQTIPLIKQTKPMVNNMKNMIHLAKAFKKETGSNNTIRNNTSYINNEVDVGKYTTLKNDINNNSFPSFFV